MNARIVPAQQGDHFTNGAFFEPQIEIQPAAPGFDPAAPPRETAEAMRRPVRAGRFARELHAPAGTAARGRAMSRSVSVR